MAMSSQWWTPGMGRKMTGIVTGALLWGAAVVALPAILVSPHEAHAQDWEVQADDERQQRVITRYREMLEEDPVEGLALERLLGHVGRGPGLDSLIEDYEQRLESNPESVNLRLVLGHLLKARGDYEQAFEQYDRARELAPQNSLTWLSRGSVSLLLGQHSAAMDDFEEALDRESSRQRRQELLQKLGELSFSQREFEQGKEFFERLLQGSPPEEEYLRNEYVRLLVQYRQFDEALDQYDRLLQMVAGDPRRRATTLADKAEVLQMQGDWDGAVETYEEVLQSVQADHWLAREVRTKLVDIFRQSGRLAEFIETYGSRWRRGDRAQQMAVADVYTEMGRLEEALELYRQIAARSRRAVEPREKIVGLLERLDRDEEVPAAYRDLMRAAPDNHRHGLALADYYMRLGDRDEAADLLDELRRDFWNQSYALLDLAEAFARWDFDDQAQRSFERVLAREADDSAVVIDVGDYFFDHGHRNRALEIWRTLPESNLGYREGSRRMAELLVERGVMSEGITVFERLIEESPDDERLLRSMAQALERARRWESALERWQQLLALTDTARQEREARSRIVRIYERQQQLRAQMAQWQEAFDDADTGSDEAIAAGFLLAEAHIRLREVSAAEQVLTTLSERQDLEHQDRSTALLLLEQAFVRSERYDEAIAVLDDLATHDPEMRSEALRRQSDHAMAARADDAAVEYAQQLLEANPDDARGQTRLGDVYRQVGRLEQAVQHYETAVDIDPRAYEVLLKLGTLRMTLGRTSEAEQALMAVVKDAPEDHLVRDAGQAMLDLARRQNRLDALESQWAALANRVPVRAIHAELLFDLYDRLAGPLILRAYHGGARIQEESRLRLYELGGRAASMLVEQLRRDDQVSRMRALRMVAEMEVDLATNQVRRLLTAEEEQLQSMALAVAAGFQDPSFVEPLAQVLEGGGATQRQLALWALGHIDDDQARQILVELVANSPAGWEFDLALFGLGALQSDSEVDVVRRAVEELSGARPIINGERAALVLRVFERTIQAGQGEQLRSLIGQWASGRQDRTGTQAAITLGAYGDTQAAAMLWSMALSDSSGMARRGEMGLAALVDDTELRPRQWRDEMRFFDWQDADFSVHRLLASARLRPSTHGESTPQDWNDTIAQGLRQALEDEPDQSWTPLIRRMSDGGSRQWWNGERRRQTAQVMLEFADGQGADDEPEAATALAMQIMGNARFEGGDAIDDGDTSSWVLLLAALAEAPTPPQSQAVTPFLERALDHDAAAVRRTALEALAAFADSDGQRWEEPILDALNDPAMAVQIAAVKAVAAHGLHGATPQLAEMEAQARPNLRRALRQAQRALGSP